MLIKQKKFNPELNIFDTIGRKAVKQELLPTKYSAVDNPFDHTGVDLFIFLGEVHVANIEVLVKRKMGSVGFPYDFANICFRKRKYLELPEPTLFVMYNEECTHHACVTPALLRCCKIEEQSNKYIVKGEFFFKVPKNMLLYLPIQQVLDEMLKNVIVRRC